MSLEIASVSGMPFTLWQDCHVTSVDVASNTFQYTLQDGDQLLAATAKFDLVLTGQRYLVLPGARFVLVSALMLGSGTVPLIFALFDPTAVESEVPAYVPEAALPEPVAPVG